MIPSEKQKRYELNKYNDLIKDTPDVMDSDLCPMCHSTNVWSITINEFECGHCGHSWVM